MYVVLTQSFNQAIDYNAPVLQCFARFYNTLT